MELRCLNFTDPVMNQMLNKALVPTTGSYKHLIVYLTSVTLALTLESNHATIVWSENCNKQCHHIHMKGNPPLDTNNMVLVLDSV